MQYDYLVQQKDKKVILLKFKLLENLMSIEKYSLISLFHSNRRIVGLGVLYLLSDGSHNTYLVHKMDTRFLIEGKITIKVPLHDINRSYLEN